MNQRARKRFGQNFLTDGQVIERCVAAIAPRAGQRIVEIGPGRAALTRPLLAAGADLVAVEIDRDLAAGLARQAPGLEVVAADALEVDFGALAGTGEYRLVGNLPYNISTPLLFHLLAQTPPPRDLHFMLQAEVVERMHAAPGGKTYGRLSLMCQNRCEVTPLFRVPPEAFEPRPQVVSAFVRLTPRPRPRIDPQAEPRLAAAFDAVVRQAFSRRRKTLRNALRGLLDESAIRAAGVDPGQRPEQLGFVDFARLAARYAGDEAG